MKRSLKVLIIAALSVMMVLGMSCVVFADDTYTLDIDNTIEMFKPGTTAELKVGVPVSKLTLKTNSTSITKFKSGDTVIEKEPELNEFGGYTFKDIPVETGRKNLLEAWSEKNSKYYTRALYIDLTVNKAYFMNTTTAVDGFYKMDEEHARVKGILSATPDLCSDLIDAIYVQVRDSNTDPLCAAAKGAWDGLTAEEKDEVEDPDYFGRDTGDATKDNTRNQDGIRKKELLVVSFGTSFNDSRVKDIKGIEDALAAAYPDWDVRRAFTAQIIINHIQAREGDKIDNMEQALDRAVANNVEQLLVQPTHLMQGAEYDELMGELLKYQDKLNIMVCDPLLGQVGETATDLNPDKKAVAEAVVAAANVPDDTALVLMGHGTAHDANITYLQMQEQMKQLGYKNVFIGTVEGIPSSTALPDVKKAVEAAGYKKVVLRPLMVVAGDHANNDMAGDEEGSWYYGFANGGEYEVESTGQTVNIDPGFGPENVKCQIEGLGRLPAVQEVYIAHTQDSIDAYDILDVTTTKIKSFKAKAGKKKVTFTWKKNTKFQGYQLKYKVGKKTKTVTIKSAKTAKKVIKKLKKGQKVSGQIRGYKTIDGQKYYGPWAKSKTVKVK